MFGLTKIIKSATRNSKSLIDYILTIVLEGISPEGVINVCLSDHQLIYYPRKIKFGLLKNFAVDAYKNTLRKINFPNY